MVIKSKNKSILSYTQQKVLKYKYIISTYNYFGVKSIFITEDIKVLFGMKPNCFYDFKIKFFIEYS